MDRYIPRVADITIEDDMGLGVPTTTMSQERYIRRVRSVCMQKQGADTYAIGQYFDGLLEQLRGGATFLRSDGDYHPALVEASKHPQGLFNGLEITKIGPFQRAIVEAATEPPKAEGTTA